MSFNRRYIFLFLFILTNIFAISSNAHAVTYTLFAYNINDTINDTATQAKNCWDQNANCTIREALDLARRLYQSSADSKFVIYLAGRKTRGVYQLDRNCTGAATEINGITCGSLGVTFPTTISSPASDPAVIDGTKLSGSIFSVFHPQKSSRFDNLIIRNGNGYGDFAGGISIISGGISSGTILSINNCLIVNNKGGGISNGQLGNNNWLIITNSNIHSNTGYKGAGLYAQDGYLTLTNSTIQNNLSTSEGDNIFLDFVDVWSQKAGRYVNIGDDYVVDESWTPQSSF